MAGWRLLSGEAVRRRAGHRWRPQLELVSLGAPRDRTRGLQRGTRQNSLVRKVTVLISIHSTEQLFSTSGILSCDIISLPTASIFLSPDRAVPAASQWKQLLWFLIFSLMSQL